MSPAVKFMLGFVGGIVLLLGGLGLTFAALDATGRLKAPSFANRMSFDEKMRYLRNDAVVDPEVLFIGSSTTLHGLDGALLEAMLAPSGSVANLGVQDLRINQTGFLADFMLDLYGPVDHVVMVSTMLDFKDCSTTETRFFKPEHVRDYLTGGPEIFYQFKYFDPENVVKRARDIQFLRAADDRLEAVSFDGYGSMLLDVPRENVNPRVLRGDPIILDPACYEDLEALAERFAAAGIKFTYVIAPMRPSYLADRDPGGDLLVEHYERLRRHLGRTPTTIVDAHRGLDMPEEAFFDAYHLNSEKARKLTRFVGEQMVVGAEEADPQDLAEPTASAPVERKHVAHAPAASVIP